MCRRIKEVSVVFVEFAIIKPIKQKKIKPELSAMEGICWNIENDGLVPQSPDLNPVEQIWGELENKLDTSAVHSKESLWLELQKAWDNISVDVQDIY